MNPVQLEIDCKKVGRTVFENFKHSLNNYPLEVEITSDTIQTVIDFEINNEFGRKVLKDHITGNESKIQLDLIHKKVNEYKTTIVKTCWSWSENNLNYTDPLKN
jgi:hypothetical protein